VDYQNTMSAINERREQILKLNQEIRTLQAEVEPQPVDEYTFASTDGEVRLTDLFGDKDTLYVVHNMGRGCVYCTQWADGFNGLLTHLEDRAAFVVSSPDTPAEQAEFAANRGWQFRMISLPDDEFAEHMGFVQEMEGEKGLWPGVSVFQKHDNGVVRVSNTFFGPGDSFNSVWHFLDMLPDGASGWTPRFNYT